LLEVAVLRAWTDPAPGTPSGASGDIEVLYIVGLVLTGIVVLAIWEVELGRWLVRSGHKSAAPHNGDADELHPSGAACTGTNGCGSQR
jgi:hypothetical protein